MVRDVSFSGSRRALLGAGGAVLVAAALGPADALAQAAGAKVPIGIIGSGNIGGTIGGLWVKAGHPVLFSSRHPENLKDLVARLGSLARAGTVEAGDRLRPGRVHRRALRRAAADRQDHGAALKGKIVLDAGNAVAGRDGEAIADEVERDGVGVISQKYLPGTRLVRAFNTLGYTVFAREANRPDPRLAVPIAGDDAEAVALAAGLVRAAGFDPVVVGKLADARRFQRGAPGYGQSVTAAEFKQKLALP